MLEFLMNLSKERTVRFATLLITFFALTLHGLAANKQEQRVDRLFPAYDKAGSPGCALGVIRNGDFIYRKGYGAGSLELGVPLSSQSVFYMGSVSKQFTAAAVVLAAEQGFVSLDDNVRKYIPELPDYGHPVTLRQMLHHTSGFRDVLGLLDLSGRSAVDLHPKAELIDLVARQKALNYDPGANVQIYTPGSHGTRARSNSDQLCPSVTGGKNWQPSAYNPPLGLLYIPSIEGCGSIQTVEQKDRVDQGGEVVCDGRVAPLDEQPLGVEPPEHVVVLQGRDEPLRVVLRQPRPRARRAVLRDDAIDPPVRLVTQGGLVRRALARLVPLGRRVVLDDEVVPVDHPDLPVGADLGQDRRGPPVVAGNEVPGVV